MNKSISDDDMVRLLRNLLAAEIPIPADLQALADVRGVIVSELSPVENVDPTLIYSTYVFLFGADEAASLLEGTVADPDEIADPQDPPAEDPPVDGGNDDAPPSDV